MEDTSTTEDIPFDLNAGERWWRDHRDLLWNHGYKLRPRYQPGWKPSWSAKSSHLIDSEDSFVNYFPKVIDAIRIKDQARVVIKKLKKGSDELRIARYLNSEELRRDPRNKCFPILDVFSEPDDMLEFMVMPLLKKFDQPSFNSVDEVVDFMNQTLQGLSFFHSKGIAHRDCSILNIMLDAAPLFPKGFHPTARRLDASGRRLARPRRRRDIDAVKYYFTDFGISSWFDDPASRLVTGDCCQDPELPELYIGRPYDPFRSDVFILGNLFRRCLVEVYENLEFLGPLTDAMTQKDPAARPTIDEAIKHFNEIVNQQSPRFLRRLLITPGSDNIDRFLCDLGSSKREASLFFRMHLARLFRLIQSRLYMKRTHSKHLTSRREMKQPDKQY